MWIYRFKGVRKTTMVLAAVNLMLVVSGGVLVMVSSRKCNPRQVIPVVAVAFLAVIKIVAMVKMGIAQKLTAMSIVDSQPPNSVMDTVFRFERRVKYKTWLWWTRFAMVITVLQFIGATYLIFHVAKYVSHDPIRKDCLLGLTSDVGWWKKRLQVIFVVIVCFVAVAQCFTGSDVLQWRSFYATQDDAWKAHYLEVFDHGIREVLCCFGRVEYLSVMEEDEVYSVARLLGDLVAYRASGTGHLELLAGLALLQSNVQCSNSYEGSAEAPEEYFQEAATFHKFAEAAYTGLLLDLGRNPAIFLCTWVCRQGILTPWSRYRRPKLEGDNWWRGHAAAFLKFINYPAHVLRRGRVCRERCKAAYFVVVLHYLRCVVIAVRGTETIEDLITDGLGRACPLSADDLDGLINSNKILTNENQSTSPTFTYYGHSGVVEAARDLFMQIEGDPSCGDSESTGFLSSLLGAGGECDGYSVRIVGHSLGGAISALLGIRLYSRFQNLRVFAYGPLPCVDFDVADACSEFVTSIVLDNEFSARLSVGSILRLRAAAITSLAQDSETDTALIFRLARRFLYVSNYQRSEMEATTYGETSSKMSRKESDNHLFQDSKTEDQQLSTCSESSSNSIANETSIGVLKDSLNNAAAEPCPIDDPVSQFMETVPSSGNTSYWDSPEMFLPGRVIHIVPQPNNSRTPLWKGWGICETTDGYKAYVANRELFKDVLVSRSMFLDHLPWRCRHAMQKVLEARNRHGPGGCFPRGVV